MKYFAYGSNMLQSRLEKQKNVLGERIGSVQEIGTASLSDYRLAFNKLSKKDGSGKANIVHEQGSETLGVIYELSREQIDLLDNIEGRGYERTSVTINFMGEQIEVDTYIARSEMIQEELLPKRNYLDYIIQGAISHNFPEAYILSIRSIRVQ